MIKISKLLDIKIPNLKMSKNWTLLFLTLIVLGCKSEDAVTVLEKSPTVILNEVTDIKLRSVKLNGEVTDEGFSAAIDRGFVYSNSNAIPSVKDIKISSGFGKGTYSSTLDKLPVNTKYYYRAFSTNSKGTSYSETKTFNTVNVVTVTSKTGRIWMDRNLGATQAATSLTDEKAYGDLYQWGRGSDGHQIRNSSTETFTTNVKTENNLNFITNSNEPFDWQIQIKDNDKSWQGEDGLNCPCPTGFRIPTSDEWNLEVQTWTSKNSNGGYNSVLKLPIGGLREIDGKIVNVDFGGFYWSSSSWYGGVNASPTPYFLSESLYVNSSGASPYLRGYRVKGLSIRCIKN
jgi:uncharacterized protein (TIGR02145 family)